MRKFLEMVREIIFSLINGIIWSIAGSFGVFFTAASIVQAPIITLFVTLFFLLFHLSDLKTFYDDKEWLLIFSRFFFLYLFSAALTGMFRLAWTGGGIDNIYLILLIPASFVILLPVMTVYFFCARNYPDGVVMSKLQNLIEGGKKYGVFWDY
jgi:hypothetical protein